HVLRWDIVAGEIMPGAEVGWAVCEMGDRGLVWKAAAFLVFFEKSRRNRRRRQRGSDVVGVVLDVAIHVPFRGDLPVFVAPNRPKIIAKDEWAAGHGGGGGGVCLVFGRGRGGLPRKQWRVPGGGGGGGVIFAGCA